MDTKEADKSRPSPSPRRYYKNIRLSSALCKWKGIKTAAAFFHGLIKKKKKKERISSLHFKYISEHGEVLRLGNNKERKQDIELGGGVCMARIAGHPLLSVYSEPGDTDLRRRLS